MAARLLYFRPQAWSLVSLVFDACGMRGHALAGAAYAQRRALRHEFSWVPSPFANCAYSVPKSHRFNPSKQADTPFGVRMGVPDYARPSPNAIALSLALPLCSPHGTGD